MDQEEKNPGALIDTRPPEEKLKDFRFEEAVASASPVVWKEKSASQWRSFPIFDQGSSSSCVAQTLKKMLGVYMWLKTQIFIRLSASHIYQRRSNRPGEGMGGIDAFKIAQQGVTLEEFAPSEKLTDQQMDAMNIVPFMQEVGKIFKIGNFMEITNPSIDTIASIIQQTGKAVMVWFYFSSGRTPKEWVDVPKVEHPDLTLHGSDTARHSVAAVDFCLYKGKKALIIEDSWGLARAIDGRRIITEDFFKARNWFAGHFMNFAFEDQTTIPAPAPVKPHYTFNKDLEFSPVFVTDPDVVALQQILKYEGCFPANIDSTGYYGSITRESVEKFQAKHGIVPDTDPGFGRVGPKTRTVLNQLYSI